MTLSQLQYIVAIDTYGSFSKAAEKSMITQPTLSMQVRKLEEELGVVLFDRSRQPVIPTLSGREILEQARIVLRESNRILEIVQEADAKMSGRLHIGIIPTVAPYLLPYFLGPFTKLYPEIQLEIIEQKTADIVDLLQRDLLDAGILATPLHNNSIREEPLYYEEILLYFNSTHELLQADRIDSDLLEPEDRWMLSDGNCFRDHVINLCTIRSELPIRNVKYESGSLETLKKMVDVEGGHTLLPELAVLELPSREMKRIRHFKAPVPLREISLVFARSAAKRLLLEKVRDAVKTALPAEILDKGRGRLVEWN